MNFRKAYKVSLNDLQTIDIVLNDYIDENKIEIQLLNLKDDLENARLLDGKIATIHLPLDEEKNYLCNIGNVCKAMEEKNDYYYYLLKVAEIAKRNGAGLVAHADLTIEQFRNRKGSLLLIDFLEKNALTVHLENIVQEISDEQTALLTPIKLSKYINSKTSVPRAYPLLDICHYQIIRDRFTSNLAISLKDAIDLYYSQNYVIHFNSSTGSGEQITGGYHSDNFSNNIELLDNLLEYLKNYDPLLVLECNEPDLRQKPKARWLNDYINKKELG